MTDITLSVPTISCDHCKASIEGAIGTLDGIKIVEVEIDPKTVAVSFDDNVLSLDAIIDAIEDQGYDVARP